MLFHFYIPDNLKTLIFIDPLNLLYHCKNLNCTQSSVIMSVETSLTVETCLANLTWCLLYPLFLGGDIICLLFLIKKKKEILDLAFYSLQTPTRFTPWSSQPIRNKCGELCAPVGDYYTPSGFSCIVLMTTPSNKQDL